MASETVPLKLSEQEVDHMKDFAAHEMFYIEFAMFGRLIKRLAYLEAERERTCEWTQKPRFTNAESPTDWVTACGKRTDVSDSVGRLCWCGGKVVTK